MGWDGRTFSRWEPSANAGTDRPACSTWNWQRQRHAEGNSSPMQIISASFHCGLRLGRLSNKYLDLDEVWPESSIDRSPFGLALAEGGNECALHRRGEPSAENRALHPQLTLFETLTLSCSMRKVGTTAQDACAARWPRVELLAERRPQTFACPPLRGRSTAVRPPFTIICSPLSGLSCPRRRLRSFYHCFALFLKPIPIFTARQHFPFPELTFFTCTHLFSLLQRPLRRASLFLTRPPHICFTFYRRKQSSPVQGLASTSTALTSHVHRVLLSSSGR